MEYQTYTQKQAGSKSVKAPEMGRNQEEATYLATLAHGLMLGGHLWISHMQRFTKSVFIMNITKQNCNL